MNMKSLELHQMEEISGGWSLEGFICGAGFAGYGALITYGLGAALVTEGTSIAVGFGIGLVGAAVCSLAD